MNKNKCKYVIGYSLNKITQKVTSALSAPVQPEADFAHGSEIVRVDVRNEHAVSIRNERLSAEPATTADDATAFVASSVRDAEHKSVCLFAVKSEQHRHKPAADK